LSFHPHIHCVVAGGGLSIKENRWILCRNKNFFLPVAVLSKLFRGKFLSLLKTAYRLGQLRFYGNLQTLNQPCGFSKFLRPLYRINWVVYSKAPFANPSRVLHYLGYYTHRIAISNQRLHSFQDGKVSFYWKDYAHNNRVSLMRLSAEEFIRRFLMHVLPAGFVRIRHYGIFANRHRAKNLSCCKQFFQQPETDLHQTSITIDSFQVCPKCRCGNMRLVETIPPYQDTS